MKLLWKELELSDRNLIESFYEKEPVRNCDFTFANNYLWKPYYPIFFGIVEGSLVFESGEGGMSVSFPQGVIDLKKTVDALSEWFEQVGRPFKMHLVSPTQFDMLEEQYPGRFQIEYERVIADYVYEKDRLLSLSGKNLHAKKNHCNKFKKEYPDWSYEAVTPENVKECVEMAHLWWEQNRSGGDGEKEEEFSVTLEALKHMEALHLTGGLLRAGGRVVAFTLGEPCGKNMYVVHFEKALADVEGAYSMINQQFVEHEMEGFTYVNREDDAGEEGLRQAKLSYHPVFMMEKGLVTEKVPGSYAGDARNGAQARELAKEMLSFIEGSPTPYHAAANLERRLRAAEFVKLEELGDGKLVPGGRYYTTQNGSALIAVKIPKGEIRGMRIVASHSDSPCFKIKESPELRLEGRYVKLNTEKYGGMILNTWLDRPLSAAGRVMVKDRETGEIETRLVDIRKDLLVIPNVASHLNREVNEGQKLNPQVDLLPLFAQDQDITLKKLCADSLNVPEEDILGSDLYVYNRDRGRIMGADDAFIGSPRLDDLQCAFASWKGFMASAPRDHIAVYALFDNEETGSASKQGADSTFLEDVIDIVLEGLSLCGSAMEKRRFLQNSFLLSADNGHAVHPNHPEKSDPTNRPYLNGGLLLKFHGGLHYVTDGASAAFIRDICRAHDIPVQDFVNRADIPGGSTLGRISNSHVSVPAADVGLPQLAMHSAFETAGVKDTAAMAELVRWMMS